MKKLIRAGKNDVIAATQLVISAARAIGLDPWDWGLEYADRKAGTPYRLVQFHGRHDPGTGIFSDNGELGLTAREAYDTLRRYHEVLLYLADRQEES